MATPRSSLWKRMGRRNSKSQSSIKVNTSVALEETPIEADNGDGRSLSTKRAQRKAKKGSFIRKLKSSFRKTKSMSEQREDSEVFQESALPAFDPVAAVLSGPAANNLHSPAYTAEDSLLSEEVRGSKICLKIPALVQDLFLSSNLTQPPPVLQLSRTWKMKRKSRMNGMKSLLTEKSKNIFTESSK